MMWKFNEYAESVAAIDDSGNIIYYKELSRLEKKFSECAARKLVFSVCKNSIGSFAGYAAMINAKAVPAMISFDMDKELLEKLIKGYEPDYIWAPKEYTDNGLVKYIDAENGIVFEAYGYTLQKTVFHSDVALYDELALLLTTSGSTGSPKFVRQSYANILANTESIVKYLELDTTERPITTLPMSYTYGLSIINSHLYVGATLLITDKTLMQKDFWSFFKEYEATSFGGVPYTYEMLKKLRIFRMDLPSLRTMTQAGGKLIPELHKEFAEYALSQNKKFVVMYGQTEATARMGYLPADKSLEKFGSMGIAIPGGKFKLIDVDDKEITEPDTVGELVYEGTNVTLGYAECRKDLAKADERGGILVTGDMAKRDSDGYYYIVGRKKRFLKIFGKRVNLDEIDGLIKSHFDGIDSAAAGRDDCMHIFIDNEKLTDKVRAFILEKTKLNPIAVKVQYIEKIPKSDSGKTRYAELEKYI